MKGLGYLFLTIAKNKILSLRKKPALLILYVIVIVSIIFTFIAYKKSPTSFGYSSYLDIRYLYAIIAGIGLLFVFSFIETGLSNGSTLFTMADVGLLFVAPISSKKILLYGLIKQMGTTMFTAVFILYQTFNLRKSFGLSFGDILNIFIIYAIILFFCQLLSMAIYVYSNGNLLRKKVIRMIFIGLIVILVAGVFFLQSQNGGTLIGNVLQLIDLKLFRIVPVAGWAVMFFSATMEGNMVFTIISLSLFLLSSILIIMLFTHGEADYYEDVLHSTEVNYAKLQDAKDGKRISYTKKVKVKEQLTGINKGTGYIVIFYKHMLEAKRTNRFAFVDKYTILASIGAAIACKNIDSPNYIILCFLIYIQFFMAMLGKLNMELSKPYIYMIPEKSVKKVFAASMTTLLKPMVDAVIIFSIVCIVSKTSPLLNLFLALAYASSGCFFVSFSLLCQRLLGGQPNKIIASIAGFSFFLVLLGPGIGISIAAIMFLPASITFLGTLPYTLSGILITIIVFVVCGDLLDKSELGTA